MKMDNLAPEDARDWFVTVIGLAVATASGAALAYQLAPWYANAAGVAVGLYLALPRRMQVVGQTVAKLINKVRS